jgi:hypothetical protein
MRSPPAWLVACTLLVAAAPAIVAQAPLAPAPLSPATEPALPPQYEVEVLIFANRDFDPTEERFNEEPNAFDGAAATTLRDVPVFDDTNFGAPPLATDPLEPVDPLAAPLAEALSIRPLRPEDLKLGNEYRRLRALAGYTPLVHVGWLQPGLPEDDAEDFDLKTLGIVNPSGTIRVHLGARYLHITLDLTYQADAAGTAAAAVATSDGLDELALAPRYHLAVTRNARSGELHYFDHPAFGVLVRITPVPTQDPPGRRPAA